MARLNDTGNNSSDSNLRNAAGQIDGITNALSQNFGPKDFQQNGFIVASSPSADGNGLPSSKVTAQNTGIPKRDIIHWFVPEVGVINMYINPQEISYNHKKLITPERTKGGYNIQFWGEELTTIGLRGHTGSSGIEGLNVLYEIYRSEMFLFDPIALTMAADSSVTGINDLVDSALGNLGSLGDSISNATSGILGLDPPSQNILPRDVPSLASMATGIEMYYAGWVMRGFFTSFTMNESASNYSLFNYDIQFTVTQRRGYRRNSFGFQHSPNGGPSDWSTNPLSFVGSEPTNQEISNNTANAISGRGPFDQSRTK
jgi:hypothetical protein